MNSSNGKAFLSLIFILAATIAPVSFTHAGSGTFQGGKYKFCASVRFNATAAQLTQIRTTLLNGSQILADATDGQHKFDIITLVNNSGASQSSEYWINSGTGRAYATYGNYGVRGEHVNLFFDSDFQSLQGADGDAYTVAHEHAHHSYGVADEYSGPNGAAEDAPTPDIATLNYSLMDNYFTRGGRAFGGSYTLNEFCTAGNHDPDQDTWQHKINAQSTWETIAAHPKRAATAPTGLPMDAPPPAHTVTFREGSGGLHAMLLLDRSGSMDLEQRLNFAKQGANNFVNVFNTGDSLGVASFSNFATVNFPLTTITDSSTRTAAQTAINSLVADGATNIGGGLLTALGQITAQANRSCDELIILVSDGDHNTGTSPETALNSLQTEGVTVLTVGVGSGISTAGEATLQNIASQTGGKFYRISSAADLVGVFMQLSAESTGRGLLARAPEAVSSGQSKEIPVLVEAGTERATFAIALANALDEIELSLLSPSGKIITSADASQNPNINFTSGTNSKTFQVNAPEAGTWKIVTTGGVIVTGNFEAFAFGTHDGVQLNVTIAKNTLTFPEVAEIHATPRFTGENVIGAMITGAVLRPDGSSFPVQLFDDGLAEHGDGIPGDGTYSARFNQYRGDGTYKFELKVSNSNGKTYAGEDLFSSQPSNEKPVPAFTRIASTTAVVTGVPKFIVATVEYGPEIINLKSTGKFVTAYIELPGGFDPKNIAPSSIKITAIDDNPINPIPVIDKSAIGDFDNDGVPDLMVKFSRAALQNVLTPGMRKLQLEGVVSGQLFIGERTTGVIYLRAVK